jgi:uncharacterized protein (DUF2336 family)
MSDRRPSRGDEGGAARLLASARARVAAARADLMLAPSLRLTDWQRSLLASLLHAAVRGIEDDLRLHLATNIGTRGGEELHAALTSAQLEIALPILAGSTIFPAPALVATLLRRVEEHRLHRACGGSNRLLLDLIPDEDEQVSALAMDVLLGLGGRLDGSQEPLLGPCELSPELEHGLAWTIAAALRHYLVERHGLAGGDADGALAEAVAARLRGYDEGASLPAACLRLAARLEQVGRLNDDLLARSLGEAGLPLFMAALSLRARVPVDGVWEILSAPGGQGVASLLRAAGVGRAAAAAILLYLVGGEESAVAPLDLFDAQHGNEADAFVALWRADPVYRDTIAAFQPAEAA